MVLYVLFLYNVTNCGQSIVGRSYKMTTVNVLKAHIFLLDIRKIRLMIFENEKYLNDRDIAFKKSRPYETLMDYCVRLRRTRVTLSYDCCIDDWELPISQVLDMLFNRQVCEPLIMISDWASPTA